EQHRRDARAAPGQPGTGVQGVAAVVPAADQQHHPAAVDPPRPLDAARGESGGGALHQRPLRQPCHQVPLRRSDRLHAVRSTHASESPAPAAPSSGTGGRRAAVGVGRLRKRTPAAPPAGPGPPARLPAPAAPSSGTGGGRAARRGRDGCGSGRRPPLRRVPGRPPGYRRRLRRSRSSAKRMLSAAATTSIASPQTGRSTATPGKASGRSSPPGAGRPLMPSPLGHDDRGGHARVVAQRHVPGPDAELGGPRGHGAADPDPGPAAVLAVDLGVGPVQAAGRPQGLGQRLLGGEPRGERGDAPPLTACQQQPALDEAALSLGRRSFHRGFDPGAPGAGDADSDDAHAGTVRPRRAAAGAGAPAPPGAPARPGQFSLASWASEMSVGKSKSLPWASAAKSMAAKETTVEPLRATTIFIGACTPSSRSMSAVMERPSSAPFGSSVVVTFTVLVFSPTAVYV